jgi:hypothetical protein
MKVEARQQRQCKYNGTFTKPFLSWKSYKYCIFLCVCVCACKCVPSICVCGRGRRALACSCTSVALLIQNATHCHLRSLWLHLAFRYVFINCTIFGKTLLKIKCVYWFSVQHLFETFLIIRRMQWDIVINKKIIHVKYPVFCSDFNGTWILVTDFRKKLKYQVSSKSVQWDPSVFMRTEGHDEANSHFPQFCWRAKKCDFLLILTTQRT